VQFAELIHKRRMVHRFEHRAVPRDLLLKVLESARHAPSAGFSQGFDFVVLDDPAQVEWFWKVTEDSKFPYEPGELDDGPPCIVLPYANIPAYLERYSRADKERFGLQSAEAWPMPYWYIDTGMAVMLQLLAAVDEGLGGWFFGLFVGEEQLQRDLKVPEGCRPIGALGVGYPLSDKSPKGSAFSNKRRSLDSMVHFGDW
jgi:nitroreductase